MRRWTKEEVDYLEKNYFRMPIKEIAQHLNRTEDSVYSKRFSLMNGTQRKFDEDELYFPVYEKEELNKMRKDLHLSFYDLAAFSGLTYETVRRTFNTKRGSNSVKMLLGVILDDMEEKLR